MKARDEDIIESAMRHIAHNLPNVKIYQQIYAEPELGKRILDAYVNVVQFSRLATNYYQGHGYCMQSRSLGLLAANGRYSTGFQEHDKASEFYQSRRRYEKEFHRCQNEM